MTFLFWHYHIFISFFLTGCQNFLDYAREYHESVTPKAYVQPDTKLSPEENEKLKKWVEDYHNESEKYSKIRWSDWKSDDSITKKGAQSSYYDIELDGKRYNCFDGSIYTSCKLRK